MVRSLLSGAAIAAVILVAGSTVSATVSAAHDAPQSVITVEVVPLVSPSPEWSSLSVPTPDREGAAAEQTAAPTTVASQPDADSEPLGQDAITIASEPDSSTVSNAAASDEPDQGSAPPATEVDAAAADVSTSGSAEGGSDVILHSMPAPVPSEVTTAVCPDAISGSTAGAPGVVSALGVAGTTSQDLASFATRYNEIRVENCLPPVPFANIRYDSCMEQRLFWIAEDPSEDPMSAWGHIGSQRSDGVPSVGCDGNLAGGSANTGATVADKWWSSTGHRASLYKPSVTGSMANTCILFAMTHGGVPNEPYSFTRAAARWVTC